MENEINYYLITSLLKKTCSLVALWSCSLFFIILAKKYFCYAYSYRW